MFLIKVALASEGLTVLTSLPFVRHDSCSQRIWLKVGPLVVSPAITSDGVVRDINYPNEGDVLRFKIKCTSTSE